MKAYRARYSPEASRRIRKLHPQIKQEIKEGVRALVKSPLAGHELQFELAGYRSLRVRAHRIIYHVNEEDSTVDVMLVGPRRTIYEELRALLLEERN